jgi:hypothetical protein
MAYIIGLLTEAEVSTLRRRGWQPEPPPAELTPTSDEQATRDYGLTEKHQMWMVWADSGMFEIMSGPDWDTKED